METKAPCPHCGKDIVSYKNPVPTVDVLVHDPVRGVLLVERRNEPLGWALPGGFVDYGESCENAARREALEETGLDVVLVDVVGVYSDPDRDPRQHTMSVVYLAQARDLDMLKAGDDAARAVFFPLDGLPDLAFDHGRIVDDFKKRLARLSGLKHNL